MMHDMGSGYGEGGGKSEKGEKEQLLVTGQWPPKTLVYRAVHTDFTFVGWAGGGSRRLMEGIPAYITR